MFLLYWAGWLPSVHNFRKDRLEWIRCQYLLVRRNRSGGCRSGGSPQLPWCCLHQHRFCRFCHCHRCQHIVWHEKHLEGNWWELRRAASTKCSTMKRDTLVASLHSMASLVLLVFFCVVLLAFSCPGTIGSNLVTEWATFDFDHNFACYLEWGMLGCWGAHSNIFFSGWNWEQVIMCQHISVRIIGVRVYWKVNMLVVNLVESLWTWVA